MSRRRMRCPKCRKMHAGGKGKQCQQCNRERMRYRDWRSREAMCMQSPRVAWICDIVDAHLLDTGYLLRPIMDPFDGRVLPAEERPPHAKEYKRR